MKKSITITGSLGSGKSTVAKQLSKELGLTYYSTGAAQRLIANQMGLTTLELNKLSETDTSIDDKIDGVIKAMNNDGNCYIVDSRLAWHFMQDSFKVKLIVDNQIAAQRILKDASRTGEKKYHEAAEALNALIARRESERNRFLRVYGVDIENDSAFDLIVNTSHICPQEVCQIIKQAFENQNKSLK